MWSDFPLEFPVNNDATLHNYEDLTNLDVVKTLTRSVRATALLKLRESFDGKVEKTAVLMQGGTSERFAYYCGDTEVVEFRQEPFFRYVFGINEPDCYGLLDLEANTSTLFVPILSESAERWQGPNRALEYYSNTYGVDNTQDSALLQEYLVKQGYTRVLILSGMNTDSGSTTQTTADVSLFASNVTVDITTLHEVLVNMRLIKSEAEVALLKKAARMSCAAHTFVMHKTEPNMLEMQCEMLFKAYTGYYGGSRYMAYTCICGSGSNGCVLHYGHAGYPNSKILKNGDLILLDMGAEYLGYATDITRTFPVNGKFTDKQKNIYNAVLDAQKVVYDMLKPGVEWIHCHKAAELCILQHLQQLQIVKGETQELLSKNIASLFMPHGLGHLLGLNVHDVGGRPEYGQDGAVDSVINGINYLRLRRPLEAGFVVTVEPGIYFNNNYINKTIANHNLQQYVDVDVLEGYSGIGIRIEDDILITKDGYENLTAPYIPTTVEEIENHMKK